MLIGSRIFIFLLAAAAIIWLQLFLSKREGKWLGLALPGISFLVSLLMVISIVAYANIGIVSRSISEDGAIVSHELVDTTSDFDGVVGQVIVTFLWCNIPTIVLIAIYGACRDKRKRRLEMEKMQIQDLE